MKEPVSDRLFGKQIYGLEFLKKNPTSNIFLTKFIGMPKLWDSLGTKINKIFHMDCTYIFTGVPFQKYFIYFIHVYHLLVLYFVFKFNCIYSVCLFLLISYVLGLLLLL